MKKREPIIIPLDKFVEKEAISKAYRDYRALYPESEDLLLYSRKLSIKHPLGLRLFLPLLEMNEIEKKRFYRFLYRSYEEQMKIYGEDAFIKLALRFLQRLERDLGSHKLNELTN